MRIHALFTRPIPALALAILLAALSVTATPALAQDQSERIMKLCMDSEGDQAYCRCTSDLLLQGLTREEMSMFLSYLETENEQDSDFLYSMLPNDKIMAIFDQGEIQCRGGDSSPETRADEKQRMIDQCVAYDEDRAYCECAVAYLQEHLTSQEFTMMLLSMETDSPEQEDQYLAQVDADRVERIFDQADQTCGTPQDSMPGTAQSEETSNAKVRLVATCQAEGEKPGDCQCFADELALRLTPDEIHLFLDGLAAEDAGDAARADWLRGQLDQDKLQAAFEAVEQACGIDF